MKFPATTISLLLLSTTTTTRRHSAMAFSIPLSSMIRVRQTVERRISPKHSRMARFSTLSDESEPLSLKGNNLDDENNHDISECDLDGLTSLWERIDLYPLSFVPEEDIASIRDAIQRASSLSGGEELAYKFLIRMIDEWHATRGKQGLMPSCDDFFLVMSAWERSKSPQASRRVAELFSLQEEQAFERSLELVRPDQRVLRLVLRVLSSSRERGADRRLWAIFDRIPTDYMLEQDDFMYASAIRSLARSRQRDAAERAERVLREAVMKHPPGIDPEGNDIGMTVDSFNVVLTAWAKSGVEEGPKRAEALLVYMDELHKTRGENRLTPNVSSFTSLIDAYAQTNEWEGVRQAEQILNRLLDQYLQEGQEELEPNVASWTIVISAWNRLSRKNYNGAAQRAGRLLSRMEELYQDGRTTVAPDIVTYNIVMNAWSATKTMQGMHQAEEILDELNERYLDGEDEMKPTTKSLRVLVDAWARVDDPSAMDRAEALLDRYEDQMEEFQQDPVQDEAAGDIYRSMLVGWSKHGDPHRAEEYLKSMISMGMKPDAFCFDRIIEAYMKQNAPDLLKRTNALIELMDQCANAGTLEPDERVFTNFIRALTKGKASELPKKASMILKRMNAMYKEGNQAVKPSKFTYNAVLNACAESIHTADAQENVEAFKLAIGIFNTVRTDRDGLDHVSFGNMLRCAALIPEGNQRDAVISSTFKLCCKFGYVNSFVIRDLQHAASEELWRSLLQWPDGEVDIESLPASWRSRFEQKKRYGERPQPSRRRRFSSRRPYGR